jgi:hypothetical protein
LTERMMMVTPVSFIDCTSLHAHLSPFSHVVMVNLTSTSYSLATRISLVSDDSCPCNIFPIAILLLVNTHALYVCVRVYAFPWENVMPLEFGKTQELNAKTVNVKYSQPISIGFAPTRVRRRTNREKMGDPLFDFHFQFFFHPLCMHVTRMWFFPSLVFSAQMCNGGYRFMITVTEDWVCMSLCVQIKFALVSLSLLLQPSFQSCSLLCLLLLCFHVAVAMNYH